MNSDSLPSADDLRAACNTISGMAMPNDQFAARLQFIADLLADSGPLPAGPLLLWRDSNKTVRHVAVGPELVVGRHAGQNGLTLPGDQLLSRRHFSILREAQQCWLRDMDSHNGTA